MKTGEVLYYNEQGALCKAESHADNKGVVTTLVSVLEEPVTPNEDQG